VQHPEELVITIEDDGNGFEKKLLIEGQGNGWKNINSRLSLIHGIIEIDSQPDRKGTIAIITIPVQ
jgi:signal transduction histidine kinase